MSSDLKSATLSELSSDIAYGYTASANLSPVGPKYLRITDIQGGVVNWNDVPYCEIEEDKIDKYLLENGDIVIARTGNSTGENYVYQGYEKAVFASYLIRYKIDREKANPLFVGYQLRSNRWWSFVDGIKGGSAQTGANAKALGRFECYILDPEIQDRVVRVLKSLDDKIELNRQINQTLELIAQAIFKSWFVDFDPVKAKIQAKEQGRNPEHAAMCAISGKDAAELDQLTTEQYQQLAATAALFPDELEESKLGFIPKDWEWSVIGDEVDVVGGGTPSTKNEKFWEGGTYHWTTPKDLSGLVDKVLLNTERKITKSGLEKISSGLLPVDTVLMSSRAPVGYLVLAKVPTAVNQGFIAMKCNKRLTAEYVLQWANSVMDEIKQRASGSTFAEISKKTFRPMNILVPSNSLLTEFSKLSKNFYDRITESVAEIITLSTLRDSLLPKLLSGDMSVEG